MEKERGFAHGKYNKEHEKRNEGEDVQNFPQIVATSNSKSDPLS